MSRLKYTRRRVDLLKISNAARHLSNSRSLVPQTFSYFYKLEIFQPPAHIHAEDMMRIFYVCRSTAIKYMRQIQKAYNRPAFNFVTVKDMCKHMYLEEGEINKYFFHEEVIDFFERSHKLKSK